MLQKGLSQLLSFRKQKVTNYVYIKINDKHILKQGT